MPLYEYLCEACGHRFETIRKFSDQPLEICPKCGGHVQKLQSAPAIQFKGSGFYINDYARKDPSSQGKDTPRTEGKSDSKAETKSESKSDAKNDSKTETKTESRSDSSEKTSTPAESKPAAKPDGGS